MIPTEKMIRADERLIENVCDAIMSAIGDDIRGDLKSQRLIVQNSTPTRILDHMYSNVCRKFIDYEIVARPTRRGSWQLVPIFERKTGFLYVIMRENRLKTLKKQSVQRKTPHYTEALARSLNRELIAKQSQVQLLEVEDSKFENEEYIKKIVFKIFEDLGLPDNIVKRHALILFNDVNGVLLSLRCCVVDSNLNMVEEANWNEYIKVNESIVAEDVEDETSKFNDPTSGLKYKQKAKDKINQKSIPKEKDKEETKKDLQ
ncbi:hypothetical protein EV210_105158 [Anaerospora hongkongensis]|uniref:Uncharacterized protein n=1 Tax=Anaerospora hongkongensis TaxID=244830 RepID=A0A4R1Q0S7_9FIRM|nr:DUF5986 family protein [Anaerospora hongkongensis]TCL37724.1 hypothetical protein EV210_105158 [Anaerospora hongkongensis]